MPNATNTALYMHKSGVMFDLANPTPEQVHLSDIAHNLSVEPRWVGNTCRPFTVAEHSILVFQMVEHWGGTPEMCLQALVHDATEAYVGDAPGPLKSIVPELRTYEKEVLWPPIAEKFGVPVDLYPVVHEADWAALFVEAASLCTNADVSTWEKFDEFQRPAYEWMETHGELDQKVMPHPEMIEKVFLDLVCGLHEAVQVLAEARDAGSIAR